MSKNKKKKVRPLDVRVRKTKMALFPKKERTFLVMIMLFFAVAMVVAGYPDVAMWVGFLFAAYSAIANDSIQTIGTFIASNQDKKWYVLWAFLGGIFIATICYSWFTVDVVGAFDLDGNMIGDGIVDRDVSNGRLASKGYETAPTSFHFLQIAAPIFLIIMTRLRMPVSTTFILLTSFATAGAAVGSVLAKSFSGYVLSFFIGLIVFIALGRFFKKKFKGKPKEYWTIIQWITSGTLWSVWLMQDAANIAVYLPRRMAPYELILFLLVVVVGLGLLLYHKGGKIQKIVLEKSSITDVRFATIIDLVYCVILFYFKLHSNVPMSTTWVFLGLLAGRELGMTLMSVSKNKMTDTMKIIGKDFGFATIGLIVSIIIAVSVNDQLTYESMFTTIPEEFVKGLEKFFSRLIPS